MRQSCQRLFSRIAVDRRHTAEVPGIECLQQIECFRATHFTYDDSIRTVPQRGTEEVRDCHWRQWKGATKGGTTLPRFKAHIVGLFKQNL